MNRIAAVATAILGFLTLLAIGYFWFIPSIEEDLTRKAEQKLQFAEIDTNEEGALISFDGRIGTVTGIQAQEGHDLVSNISGAVWNGPKVLTVSKPSLKMNRTSIRSVEFIGSVASEDEKQKIFEAAKSAGLDVDDQLSVNQKIEGTIDPLEPLIIPLLASSDNGSFNLEDGRIEIQAEAKDPVEAEVIEAAVGDLEFTNRWSVEHNLSVVELSEEVQIVNLENEIEQIFELAREIEGESPNFGSSDDGLNPSATGILDRVMVAFRRYPLPTAEIVGHTDEIGAETENQELSEIRAAAVVEYLVNNGIDASRLKSSGKGETEPIADNETEAGREENRRVNFVVGRKGD